MSNRIFDEVIATPVGTLHLLNTSIIPWRDGLEFEVTGCEISAEEAVAVHRAFAQKGKVESHVGHQSTADAFGTLPGHPVAFSRAPWNGEGYALIFQLKQRGEEGKVYTAAELATMSAGFRLMRIQWWRQ